MRSNGIETLAAVVRRSRWLIILLIGLGIASMIFLRNAQGAQYEASARVVLSPTDLGATVAGFSGYVDPDLVDQTEAALAESRQLFDEAASAADFRLGSGADLDAVTSVDKDGSTVSFTVTSVDEDYAIEAASLIARTYPEWRASVSNTAIRAAVNEVENQLRLESPRDPDLVAQLNRLKVLETLSSGNVLLVEQARDAVKTRPNPPRDALLGGFIGLFVALVAVAIREAVDTRVRSEGEIEDLLEIPVLGRVEVLPRRTSLVTIGRNRERYGDVYALLAANIAQTRSKGIIAVTSATAGEGKTTTAANLAAALAQRNDRVALVDFDRRRPTVSKMFRIPASARGVETVLREGIGIDAVAWNVPLNGTALAATRATEQVLHPPTNGSGQPIPILHVLPLRPSSYGSEQVNPAALRDFVAQLRKRFDYVVIDTPPALSVPDVTELTNVVDVVLVVVRHGRVSASSLASLNRLHRSWPQVETNALLVGSPRHADTYTYYAST